MQWPDSSLTERLSLTRPIIQAPMAAISTAALVSAVSAAGGLGSLGSAILTAAQIREQVTAIRSRTERPFALNFFTHRAPALDSAMAATAQARLAPYRAALGLSEAPVPTPPPPFDDAMLECVLDLAPAAVSFHFGLPPAAACAALKRAGIFLLGSATTVEEATALEAAGLDALIAQGFEAGGHRGTFTEPFELGEIGLFSLLPQVVDAVRIPVVAAGGIADGRGIAAALALGAKGVQLGTAFLGCPEAAIDPLFRRTLHEPRAVHTQLTRAFTGRPARAIATRFIAEMAADAANTLEFPLQYGLTAPLGRAAASKNDPEFLAMWAGQSAPLVRTLLAAELIETLERETERALHRLARPSA